MQGGKPTPGIGFALGVERIIALLEAAGTTRRLAPQVFLVSQVDPAVALELGESLRDRVEGLRLGMALAGGSFKAQFKRADRSGARYALVIGEEEFEAGSVAIKDLRDRDAEQEVIALVDLPERLGARIRNLTDD
jgi:histidyl-tRNA synthetase